MAHIVKSKLNRTEVNLSALAREVEQELREGQPERSVELVIDDNIYAIGDRVLLRCVLANLLGNAWKFTSKCPGASIRMGKMDREDGATVFFVKDNGAGFDMNYASKLFAPFQRLHRQDEFPGTGVGLATVQRVILKHGGRIWAESGVGQGTTFFFTLPADVHKPCKQEVDESAAELVTA